MCSVLGHLLKVSLRTTSDSIHVLNVRGLPIITSKISSIQSKDNYYKTFASYLIKVTLLVSAVLTLVVKVSPLKNASIIPFLAKRHSTRSDSRRAAHVTINVNG